MGCTELIRLSVFANFAMCSGLTRSFARMALMASSLRRDGRVEDEYRFLIALLADSHARGETFLLYLVQ
jgi:hypothetical protein